MDKKKAELQRKLTLGPVARPPAGLSRRIKDDIPKYLQVNEIERRRLSRSMMLNLRVAASILFLVSGVYVFMQLSERGAQSLASKESAPVMAAPQRGAAADVATAAAPKPMPATAAAAPAIEQPSEIPALIARAEPAPSRERLAGPPSAAAPPPPPPAPVAPPAYVAHEEVADATGIAMGVEGRVEGGVAGGTVGGWVGGVVGGTAGGVATERVTVTASAPMVLETAAAQTSAPAPAPAPPVPQAKTAAQNGFLRSATAAEMDLEAKDSVFGISVDHGAFQRVKSAIERGERPSATAVNVEALVNYFAGPAGKVRGEVKLEAEASPAPVRGAACCILRFTVDTGTAAIPAGGSIPPVATDAKIHINLNPAVVVSHRRIGGPDDLDADELTLLRNTSVTGLYALEIRNAMPPRQRVATITLTYRSVATGHQEKVSQTLFVRDFARTWSSASRRHRLASLGAVWGETLQRAGAGTDVAQRAEELATEEPKDERARELATWAAAASRIGAGTATGSGR